MRPTGNSSEDHRWRPEVYLRYAAQRLRPALDLLSRVPLRTAGAIVDLGCGAGSAFELLTGRFPGATLEGVDASASMLERAHRQAEKDEALRQHPPLLVEQDIESWVSDRVAGSTRYDLVFSNAALHWLDSHHTLLPRLIEVLTPGGVLAVQMPRNWAEPSHALIRRVLKTLSSPRAAQVLLQLEREPVASAAWYHRLLGSLCEELDVWETTYLHELDGRNQKGSDEDETTGREPSFPVLEWVRSTALRPVVAALAEEGDQAALDHFLRHYEASLRAAYGSARPSEFAASSQPGAGTRVDNDASSSEDLPVLFPFRRLFLVARRPR